MSDAPAVSLEAKSPFELRVHLGDAVPEQSVREALASGDMGFLHSYTTGSTVDGPGVRVVAWTTGCMWRCQYCHNPDTWTLSNGMPVSVAKAAEELGKYRHGLKVMSGGFTLSGGEPLMQHRFAAKLLAAAKKMGIHTTIETNGFYGDRLSDAELDTIDLVMLGIKTWDPARHLALTGKEIGPTLEFARRLAARRRPMWIRFVLVPGLTDDLDDLAKTAEFAAGLGNVERVEVLPFHQMGRYKWERLGLDYTLKDVEPPTAEAAERACEVFRKRRAHGVLAPSPAVRRPARRCGTPRQMFESICVAQLVERPGGVAELVDVHAQLVEQRDVQVRQRRALRIADVAVARDPGRLAANQRDRQVVVEVRVAVADRRAVEEQRRSRAACRRPPASPPASRPDTRTAGRGTR